MDNNVNVSGLVLSASTNLEEVFVGGMSPIQTSIKFCTTSTDGFNSVIYFSFVNFYFIINTSLIEYTYINTLPFHCTAISTYVHANYYTFVITHNGVSIIFARFAACIYRIVL